jgi:Zn-dependent protease
VLGVLGLRLARPLLLPLLPDTAAATAFELIRTTIELGLWFALFGLVPVPPLVGGQLLVAVVPKLRDRLPHAQLVLGLIVAGMVATGWVTRALDPAFRLLMGFVGEDVGM